MEIQQRVGLRGGSWPLSPVRIRAIGPLGIGYPLGRLSHAEIEAMCLIRHVTGALGED